jgi:hypothetical protein
MWSVTARRFIQLTEQIFRYFDSDLNTGRVRSALVAAARQDLDELDRENTTEAPVLTGEAIQKDPVLSQGISYTQA